MNTTTSSTAAAPDAVAVVPPRGKGRFLVVAALALVVLVGGGAGAWWWFLRAPAVERAPKVEVTVRATVPLGAVVININGEPRRFLRAAVSLGLSNAQETKAIEERKPELLDLLIRVLSTTDMETLASGEGRDKLKAAVLARIRGELGVPTVARVYFTEFVIQ